MCSFRPPAYQFATDDPPAPDTPERDWSAADAHVVWLADEQAALEAETAIITDAYAVAGLRAPEMTRWDLLLSRHFRAIGLW